MNSNAGASDKAEIEVIRGTPPPVGMVGVSGEFHITAHHQNGEEFYRNTVKNATTTEWLTEMLEIFGGPNANLGTDHTGGVASNGVIQSFIGTDATYGTPTGSAYQYLIGLGTAADPNNVTDGLVDTDTTYANIADGTAFSEVAASTAGITGYTRQEFSIADGITHATADPNCTVTNGTGGTRATWTRGGSDTGTLSITCVMMVFSHSNVSDDATVGANQAAGSLNRLICCADIAATPVDLLASDTINVQYTYTLTASL